MPFSQLNSQPRCVKKACVAIGFVWLLLIAAPITNAQQDSAKGQSPAPEPLSRAPLAALTQCNDLVNAVRIAEQRVARDGYIVVESYRTPQELFNLQCWALTAETFFDVETWIWVCERFGYRGDYEFIFF